MSAEITREERRATIRRWAFQHVLMDQQGFNKAYFTAAGGKPRAYEHYSGIWRISTALKGKWKLERWTGRWYYPYTMHRSNGVKVWAAYDKRFDTPLAVALWFDLMRIALGSEK